MANTDTEELPDHAGVGLHPPLFYMAMLAISAVLNKFHALPIFRPDLGIARLAGLVPLLGALGIIAAGRHMMQVHSTNINPTRPTTAIIQRGPYRFSRNPLYLALTVGYCGIALLINTWWAYILLPVVLASMHFLVIRREERYLERKFGDVYLQYKSQVRRYL